MALIVEDGSGLPDAESPQSVADIAAYAAKYGRTFPTGDVPAAEAAARRASVWLDGNYRPYLPGTRRRGRDQGTEWPRSNAYDVDLNEIPDDEVPREWKMAHSEVAIAELASPGVMSPTVTPGRVEKSVSIHGAVSVTYADEGGAIYSSRPVMTVVDDILSSLFPVGSIGSGTGVVFLSRA